MMKNNLIVALVITMFFFTNCSGPSSTNEPESRYNVGDIVLNDGTSIPYSLSLNLTDEQKNKAIAVIFYKGNACSNSGKIRTLGVGLRQGTERAWCYNGNADGINIATIQCVKNGPVFVGDKEGIDNLTQIGSFLSKLQNAYDDTLDTSNYSAFYFAKGYRPQEGSNVGFMYGWYLPSIAELYELYKRRKMVSEAFSRCGKPKLKADMYWSSTDHYPSSDTAAPWRALAGDFATDEEQFFLIELYKTSHINVVAIREF